MKNKPWLIAGLIIILAVAIRLIQFGSNPISLYWDEVAIGLDARSIVQTNLDMNHNTWLQPLFYSYGDYKAPIYILIVALLAKFFSLTQALIRLPNLLGFIGLSLSIFGICRLILPKKPKFGYLTLITLGITPWVFHFSRIGMESFLSLSFLTASLYFLIAGFVQQKTFKIILSGLWLIVGIYSYIGLRVLGPTLFIFTYLIFSFPKPFSKLKPFLISLSFVVIGLLILMKSPFYTPSQQYRLSNDNLLNSTTYTTKPAKLKQFLINYSNYFSPSFLFLTGDPNLRHHSGFGGELLLVQLPLLILGLIGLLKLKKQWLLWILLLLFSSPLTASLVNETPHASRAIYAIIPLSLIIGLGFTQLKSVIKSGMILLLLLNFSFFLFNYYYLYPDKSKEAWINPYKQAAVYFNFHPTSQPILVTDQYYQPSLYFKYYANLKIQALPSTCPSNALCIVAPNWDPAVNYQTTTIPGTDKLVIKAHVQE